MMLKPVLGGGAVAIATYSKNMVNQTELETFFKSFRF
jgi:hypothetical protein